MVAESEERGTYVDYVLRWRLWRWRPSFGGRWSCIIASHHVGRAPKSWRATAFRLRKSYTARVPSTCPFYGTAAVDPVKMPVTKATKKFEKNKLSGVLKKRKDVAKIKQRKQMDAKRKQRKVMDNTLADGVEPAPGSKPTSNGVKDDAFGEMSMDQFFQGGFQVPEMKKKKKSTKPQTGKRKRTPVEGGDPEDSDVDMADTVAGAEESGSDSDSDGDIEAHKKQLAGLAEKDPEFYKHLKAHDPELLDFEDDDLDALELSASEDEKTPRKKRKSDKAAKEDAEPTGTGNEVSKKVIQKWKQAMEDKSSLRATKEVVLAFRSAAHLDDETKEGYKYSISDSDGSLHPPTYIRLLSNRYSVP